MFSKVFKVFQINENPAEIALSSQEKQNIKDFFTQKTITLKLLKVIKFEVENIYDIDWYTNISFY